MHAFLVSSYDEETSALTAVLQKAGFRIRTASTLSHLTISWPTDPLDLIMISMGEFEEGLVNNFKQLRQHTAVPILLIMDAISENHRVAVLDAGIDCLLSRPYGIRELTAQIRALMRRSAGTSLFHQPSLTQSDVTLDPSSRTVQVGSLDPVRLTHLEFRLLHTLITNPGQIIPSENLVEYVWGYSGEGNRDLVRGLVQRLRNKLEPDPHQPTYIINSPGIGYAFQKKE
jgi:DNA-binding response OmpR family regulator